MDPHPSPPELRIIIATTARGSANRNDAVHDRGSRIATLCQGHGRTLADGDSGIFELITPTFVDARSCAIERGVDVVDVKPGSNT